jgi:hypothetical protein
MIKPADQTLYTETVELLRDLSRNHAAAAADMCRCGWPSEEGLDPEDLSELTGSEEPVSQEVEDLGTMLRDLEDVGLRAVCRLARACDERAVLRAIEEAHAEWLGGVILNRAAETVGHGRA